ncbi:MAG: AAA family ATPase [Gallionella sp.]
MKQPTRDHDGLPELVERLLVDPTCFDHPVPQLRLIETHISWVVLTGAFAYKIKKPLDLGFLNFSTLPLRKQACENEIRLNRRLAAEYYLGVVAITGDAAHPRISGGGTAVEYAVKMKQFAPDVTLDQFAARGALQYAQIDAVAARLAKFHLEECEIAPVESRWGRPESVAKPVTENFLALESCLEHSDYREQLATLRNWSETEHKRLIALMRRRKRDGMIRECHGDLHLGNLAWVGAAPLIFDCIEFNDALRWIDVISEVAFIFMDLLHRNLLGHAMRLLNAWLEASGDYDGVALLRYYTVYRALVRAKVAGLRLKQTETSDELLAEVRSCLHLAEQLTQAMPTQLWITHGLSGSGKTIISQQMLQDFGMIRIRSDVERKRLAGLKPMDRTHADVGASIYSAAANKKTYRHLAKLAERLLKTGWPVIGDAAFLIRWQRERFLETARRCECPYKIIDVQADVEVLRRRVSERSKHGGDASEADSAVLQHQIETALPLEDYELAIAIRITNTCCRCVTT